MLTVERDSFELKKAESLQFQPFLHSWPRQESNLHLQNRNLKFYPLKYGARIGDKNTIKTEEIFKDLAIRCHLAFMDFAS